MLADRFSAGLRPHLPKTTVMLRIREKGERQAESRRKATRLPAPPYDNTKF